MLGHTIAYFVVITVSLLAAYAMGKPQAPSHHRDPSRVAEIEQQAQRAKDAEDAEDQRIS